MFDHAVVGSGPSGVQAAQTLIEAGRSVVMLDVGHRDPHGYAAMVPDKPFLEVRRSDPEQHRYFLGDAFEGIPLGRLRSGSTITTPRRYVMDLVDDLVPSVASDFHQVESLAEGGLGAAWGLACFAMSNGELGRMGLDPVDMAASYRRIAGRIGLSGEHDDMAPYTCGPIDDLEPALDLDIAATAMLVAYRRRRDALRARGIHVGKPMLALLSRDRGERRGCAYHDMEFWSDHGGSAYRPSLTLAELRRNERFAYWRGALVLSFAKKGAGVRISFQDLATGQRNEVIVGSLVLAAGTLGTTRIVLRSVYPDPASRPSVPLLCDPYFYVLCIRPGLIGRPITDHRHSVTQLVMAYDADGSGTHVPIAAFTGYLSPLLFKLIKETPLGRRDARRLLQLLLPALVVAGIHHPNVRGPLRTLELVPDADSPTGDAVRIRFDLDGEERAQIHHDQGQLLRAFRSLGSFPLRTVDLGYGSSIYYAGTLPAGEDRPHGTDRRTGRLRGWDNVYVADGSPFTTLPAKGITLTLMANADRVARQALRWS